MRIVNQATVVAALLGALCWPSVASAEGTEFVWQAPGNVQVEPKAARDMYPWNTLTGQRVAMTSCVQFAAEATKESTTPTGVADPREFTFEESSSSIAASFGIDATATFSAEFGVGSASASMTMKMLEKSAVSRLTRSLVARAHYSYGDTTFYMEELELTPKAANLIATDINQFQKVCGNGFVIGYRSASWFRGVASLQSTSASQMQQFELAVEAKGGTDSFKAAADATLAKSFAESISSISLKISPDISNPAVPGIATIDGMVDAYLKYDLMDPSARRIETFAVAPYGELIAKLKDKKGTPAFPQERNGLQVLSDAFWDLRTVIAGAAFVEKNPDTFALGLTKSQRDARHAFVKKLNKQIEAESKEVLAAGRACSLVEEFDKDPNCSRYAEYWRGRDILGMLDWLPTSYGKDCTGAASTAELRKQGGEVPMQLVTGDDAYTTKHSAVDFAAHVVYWADGAKVRMKTLFDANDHKYVKDSKKSHMQGEKVVDAWEMPAVLRSECRFAENPVNVAPSAILSTGEKSYGSIHAVIPEDSYAKDTEDEVVLVANGAGVSSTKGVVTKVSCDVQLDTKNAKWNTWAHGDGLWTKTVRPVLVDTLDDKAASWVAPALPQAWSRASSASLVSPSSPGGASARTVAVRVAREKYRSGRQKAIRALSAASHSRKPKLPLNPKTK